MFSSLSLQGSFAVPLVAVAVMVKIKSVPLAFLEPGCHAHMHNQRGDLSLSWKKHSLMCSCHSMLDYGHRKPFMNLLSTAAFCGLGEYKVSLKKNYPITISFVCIFKSQLVKIVQCTIVRRLLL